MNKKFKSIIGLLIIIACMFSMPNVLLKIKTESSNQTVELIASYQSVLNAEKQYGETIKDEIFSVLLESGVTSIGLHENSLFNLENRSLIGVYNGQNLIREIFTDSEIQNFEVKKTNTYIVVPDSKIQEDIISTIIESNLGKSTVFQGKGQQIIELEDLYNKVYRTPILYLESDLKTLSDKFIIVPRISNKWGERLNLIDNQIQKWNSKKPFSFLLFEGPEVVGFKNGTIQVHEEFANMGVGSIEVFAPGTEQKGISSYAKESMFNIVRVHSLPADRFANDSDITLQRLVKKAAAERNIRAFYLNLPTAQHISDRDEYMKILANKSSAISQGLKDAGFELNKTGPFASQNPHILYKIANIASLLGILYMAILALVLFFEFKFQRVPIKAFILLLSSGTVGVMALAEGATEKLINDVASLGITVLVPVWASIILYVSLERKDNFSLMKNITFPIVSIVCIGLVFLTSLHANLNYITYVDSFRGVSATLLIPPLLMLMFMLFMNRNNYRLNSLLAYKIRLVDVIIVGIIGIFVLYYEMRSGNGGVLLPFEELLRGKLEDILPARPRTKEVFLAFPLLVILISFWKKSKWVKYLLPVVTIGFASIFNTFTHFHTPVLVSLTRTVLSVTIGLVIGFLITLVLKTVLYRKK